MASVVWTPKALNDLEAVYLYIARTSARMAETFVLRVEAAVDQLSQFPGSGRLVQELRASDVRELIVQQYRVFYRVRANQVEVLSILHGSRNIGESAVPLPEDV